jgi:broad specificity phosphatase PhoE
MSCHVISCQQANVQEGILATLPDNKVPLTARGIDQAMAAGAKLRELVGHETLRFFVSPYMRTMMTYDHIRKSFDPERYVMRQEPRLREQDFGNFQNADDMNRCRVERQEFGSFYYRFPQGESGADVYDRVSTFIETMHREFLKPTCGQNFVLVSHGLTARLFLMRYFHWEVEKFHRLWNLQNCQIVVCELNDHNTYSLVTPLREGLPGDDHEIAGRM